MVFSSQPKCTRFILYEAMKLIGLFLDEKTQHVKHICWFFQSYKNTPKLDPFSMNVLKKTRLNVITMFFSSPHTMKLMYTKIIRKKKLNLQILFEIKTLSKC